MALDVTTLRQQLYDYRQSLLHHQQTLQTDFEQVQGCFRHLNEVYAGHSAETVKTSWRMTAEWVEEYLTETRLLIQLLDERLTALDDEQRL